MKYSSFRALRSIPYSHIPAFATVGRPRTMAQLSSSAPDLETEAKMKSPKELEKERKKAEKQRQFDEKKAKMANAGAESKTKEKKAKAAASKSESMPEFTWEMGSGEKKHLSPLDDPINQAYIPTAVESGWYAWWEKEGFFKPTFSSDGNIKDAGYFVIPTPPPNVTGALHMGHALPNALQDTLIRWNRMRGLTTLWLPGCDHAGISTQSVVEKMLWKRERKTRHDLGRPKMVETIWDWKEEYHSKINNALRRMGGSFDWSREAFTMNPTFSAAVTETFCTLHEEGLIYRSNRLVNWCTQLNTSLSNLEVDNIEIQGRTMLDVPGYDKKIEFGVLTHFQYEIEGTSERIEVATTRPETMLGDTGVAVHPEDQRYAHLIGNYAMHPFLNRRLPIFTDMYVDKEFGTGAVKMTPAHDPNDFKIGQAHGLEFINILTDTGLLNQNTGEFEGMRRFDARYKVIEALKSKGLYTKQEPNPMSIPLCSKTKDIIEPIMKPQWWLKMKGGLADAAIKAVRDGEITIKPEKSEADYFRWMENIQDWCLSRQLWWGHQAPAYFIDIEGESGDDADGELWVTGRTEEAAMEKAQAKFPEKQFKLKRDEDVLDTWFSSGLWPFATLGWPNTNSEDFKKLYPTSVLETGWDILFFWVARMIMFGIKMAGQVPFREVYCHSLVRDSEGRKMSKSLGNVIDPLDVMGGVTLEKLQEKLKQGNLDPKEIATATKFQKSSFPNGIPECGADALRFSLINYTTGGGDINFDIQQMHGYRRFCNKIYQATKFVLGKLDKDFTPKKQPSRTGKESLAELWILHKFTTAASEINTALAAREFASSTKIAYEYWYNHLCDVYIENSKSIIQDGTPTEQESAKQTLYTALEGGLTMIHPFMPFISEELWQRLPRRPEDSTLSICLAAYPQYHESLHDPEAEKAYELILALSKAIRSLAAQYAILESATIYIQPSNPTATKTCEAQLPSIKSLGGKAMITGTITIIGQADQKPSGCVAQSIGASAAVYLLVKGRIDIDAEIEKTKTRLAKAREAVEKQRKMVEGQNFGKMAGEAQETERRKLGDKRAEEDLLEASVGQFERLKLE